MSDLSSQDYKLLNAIIDANQRPKGWQSLLENFLEHFKLSKINLFMLDSESNILFQEWSGMPLTTSEIEGYFNNSQLSVSSCKNIPEKNEQVNSPGPSHTIDYALHQGQKGQVLIRFQRNKDQDPFTLEEEKRITHMRTFLAKAIELRIKFSEQDKSELRLISILNKLRLPASYLDESGRIIIHNNAMNKFLKSQTTLKIIDSKPVLTNKKDDHLLKHAISNSMGSSKAIDSPLNSNSLKLAIGSNGESFTVGASRLAENSADGEILSGALLYVVSPTFLKPIKPSQLRTLFGLTEAESQVCSLFSKNMTLKEISVHENKSVNTVREQLQNCYIKSNTQNQFELINLLSGLPADN